jgi:hypothetical protein
MEYVILDVNLCKWYMSKIDMFISIYTLVPTGLFGLKKEKN